MTEELLDDVMTKMRVRRDFLFGERERYLEMLKNVDQNGKSKHRATIISECIKEEINFLSATMQMIHDRLVP